MELNTLNDVSGREGAERNGACPCVNKGKRVCAVSGRSIASLHITWCKGIIYNTARHVPTALFKMHDLSRSRPARLCLRWLEGSVNHALQRATLRSAAAPFQCNDGEPRGTVLRGVVQKIHGHKLSLPARWYACYVFFNSSRCYQLREHFFCSSQKMSHRIDLASAHI